MGNHQTTSKRQHRPSESVGFNKHDSDDERLVTILKREHRISTKSAPPFEENSITIHPADRFISSETIEYQTKFGYVHFLYVNSHDKNVNNHFEQTVLSLHKSIIWTQEINNQLVAMEQPPPPRIPPHLLNILLNQKLPAHCDPNVLPEPNSVMLQHLYALSIQNGIMILSTTIRYKQKFVTTCFYKPN